MLAEVNYMACQASKSYKLAQIIFYCFGNCVNYPSIPKSTCRNYKKGKNVKTYKKKLTNSSQYII